MSLYVLDTDHVSLQQREDKSVIAKIHSLDGHTIAVTVVTVQEQMRGRLAQLGEPGVNLPFVYGLLQASTAYFCRVPILPFDTSAQLHYQNLRLRRIRIGVQDMRIAAIALAQNGILVTRNGRDFERVPGLWLEDWSQ